MLLSWTLFLWIHNYSQKIPSCGEKWYILTFYSIKMTANLSKKCYYWYNFTCCAKVIRGFYENSSYFTAASNILLTDFLVSWDLIFKKTSRESRVYCLTKRHWIFAKILFEESRYLYSGQYKIFIWSFSKKICCTPRGELQFSMIYYEYPCYSVPGREVMSLKKNPCIDYKDGIVWN